MAQAIRRAVRQGGLAPGERLPPSRRLAADLAIARGPVVEAYQQLIAEGYAEARQGSGTFVRRQTATGALGGSGLMDAIKRATAVPPTLPAPSTIRFDLRPGLSDLSLFPRTSWQRSLQHVLRTVPHSELAYPDPVGAAALREALARHLQRTRGTLLPPGQLVVTAGSTQAVAAMGRALVAAGHRHLAVEDPTDARERRLLQAVGLDIVPVPVDPEGIDVSRLDRSEARAVLVAPTHHFPTGVALSPGRRAELVDWARSRDGVIIEDDYDSEFQYRRPAAGCLQALAPDRVVLVGSVGKSLAPALRIGWAVAPPPLAEVMAVERATTDFGTATLDQLALAQLLVTGAYARHLRRALTSYRGRRKQLLTSLQRRLPQARVLGVPVGLHVSLTLPGADEKATVQAAAERGVAIQAVREMRLLHHGEEASFVLGVGQLREECIDEAVGALAQAVRPAPA